jgi:hypothetical protein
MSTRQHLLPAVEVLHRNALISAMSAWRAFRSASQSRTAASRDKAATWALNHSGMTVET